MATNRQKQQTHKHKKQTKATNTQKQQTQKQQTNKKAILYRKSTVLW